MPTVLITGASRGLGLELASQYAADGWRVVATARDPDNAPALAGIGGKVEVHRLDVTDHARIQELARRLRRLAVDLLLNNAGIWGPRPAPLGGIDYAAWGEVFRVNAMAPLKVAESFVEHVGRGQRKLIVTVTSRMGSIADNDSGGAYIYRSSKAALNAVMRSLSVDLKSRGITVAVLHPGWVRTDMGGRGAQIEPADSVAGMRKVIAGLGPGDSGRFFNYDGNEVPW